MSTNLKTYLRARLEAAYYKPLPREEGDIFEQFAGMPALVDEVIKQMEWAYDLAYDDCMDCERGTGYNQSGGPLEAPPDWRL